MYLTFCLVESDWDRIIKNIERGEARIARKDEINRALKKKLERYKNPWLELKIQYGQNKGKLYNEECDRFMVWIYTFFLNFPNLRIQLLCSFCQPNLQTSKFSSSNIYCSGVIFGYYM
jgi:SLIDE